jgi:DNA-binding MarR family transcriptional regulator
MQAELALEVLGQFRLIFRSVKKHFQHLQDRTGVSGAQIWALAELERRPGLRVSELARSMAVHQSTASNLVDRLQRAGLVRRARSAQDQRVVHLTLTASGRRLIARAPRPLEGVLPDALNTLTPAQLRALRSQLDGLARCMKVRDRGGQRALLSEM